MRFLLHIILLLTVLQAGAQDNKRVNFALINYDSTGKKLIFEDQETFLSTLLSFGDKNIILEEVFKRLLKSQDFTTEDSLVNAWVFSYEPQDSIEILKLPMVVNNWREIAFHLVRVTYMGQSYLDSVTLSEAYLNIHKARPEKFPNIPDESTDYEGQAFHLVEKYYEYNKWYLDHPDEFNYFVELAKKQAKRYYGSDSNKDVIKFFDHVKKDAIATNSINEQNIPMTLNAVLAHYESQKIRTLKYVEECTEENIDVFLTKSYELIYSDTIPPTTLSTLSSFIQENNVYDPELIYLALILSKYE